MVRTLLALVLLAPLALSAAAPVAPAEPVALFNGNNLDGFSSWLKDTKREDPKKVFRVTDGLLHATGDGFGYLATAKEYKDYRAVLEFKWGKKTDGGKYVRNSGLLVHGTGPDGAAGGTWMASVEVQLAQGCVGDLIPIRGTGADGKVIPVSFASDVKLGPDKRPRWVEGGEKVTFTGRQLWWHKHDPDFKELLDTNGKDDVESKLGEWTKVEVECAGSTITVFVNGVKVNRAYDVFPASGKVLLQVEGFELFVRRFELQPLKK